MFLPTSQYRRPRARAAQPVALLAAVSLAVSVGAPAASAKTVTLHLFSRATSSTFVDAQGHPLSPSTPPAVGDTFDDTGVDYLGNHNHHAARPNGTDHLRCTITSIASTGPRALCSG